MSRIRCIAGKIKQDRGMAGIGKSSVLIGATIPKDIAKVIDSRSKLVGQTRSKFLSKIAAFWAAQGCPPVDEIDQAMSAMAKQVNALRK